MKKILLIIFIICGLFLSGCSKDKDIKLSPNKDGFVIEYIQKVNGSEEEIESEDYYYISLKSDKKISWGKTLSGEEGNRELTDEEYNDIVSYAFSKKITKLKEDISDHTITDGSTKTITLFCEDGTKFITGGLNPTNKNFNKLLEKLINYTE